MRNLAIICMVVVRGAGSCGAKTAELLGPYIGASIGWSDVRLARTAAGTAYPFSVDRAGWKVMAGIRPLSLLGAEVEYLDFGNPTYSPPPGLESWHTKSTAAAAFGMLYAPIPGPFVDVYAKLGVARLRSDVTTYYWAARLEYERIDTSIGDPSMASLGVTWTF